MILLRLVFFVDVAGEREGWMDGWMDGQMDGWLISNKKEVRALCCQ